MQPKHYGTLAGDDELVSDKPEPPNNSAELNEELRRAGVQTGPSRVVATIGLVVSAVFVGLVLLVAVTNGGRDMSTLTSFGAGVTSIMSALQAPAAQSYDLQDPTQDVPIITTTTTVSTGQYPNFVVIVADDLGWNALSYNDEDISFATPTLAGLASKGIIMGNYYAQEVCSPSRASLLTGRYPLSVGMQYGMVAATAEWGLDLDEVTIAEVLIVAEDSHLCVVD